MRFPRCAALLVAILPSWAGALDMEYYTYNAFEETVAAFQRISLVLQDPSFTVFVGVFAIIGVLIGGLLVGAKGMQGQQVNPISFLIPVAVGVALFRAFIWPTGTLFIYDPVRNATQAVGDVPDAVVLMAGALNKIERGVAEIVQTASADPDAERSGALRYSLVLNALNARGTNLSLERNLVNYYLDCGLPSMSLGFNGVSHREAERSTADLYETFARFAHPSFSTFAFTGAGDSTTTMTCAAMWTDHLNPALNGAGALSDIRDVICAKTGFDMAVPAQLARCDTELQTLGSLYGLTPSSSLPFIRSSQIAIAMTNALRSGDISVQTGSLVNRQVMAEGMGVAEALDRWVPKVRGFMTAAVLGMVPLVLLFAVTPLLGKSLQLLAGLFLWLTLWGIADAVSVSMAADAAADSFDQMGQYGFSHMSFMLSPEGAIQSLGVFGKARAMALMMATVISYAIFQFGGYAFTNLAGTWQNDVQQMGESAGRTAMLPEERAAMLQRLGSAPGTEMVMNRYGAGAVMGGAAMGGAQQAREAQLALGPYVGSSLNGAPELGSAPSSDPEGLTMGAVGGSPAAGSSVGGSYVSEQIATGSGMGAMSAPGASARKPSGPPTSSPSPSVGSTEGATDLAEIVVTGRNQTEPSEPASIFSNFTDRRAEMQMGTMQGAIESRQAIAERQDSTIYQESLKASRFGDEKATTAALTERGLIEELGESAHSAGYLEGQRSTGQTIAGLEIAENVSLQINEPRDGAATAAGMGIQENASRMGATEAGAPRESVLAYKQQAISFLAEGKQLERDGTAAVAGAASATRAGVQGLATQKTRDDFGMVGMVHGSHLSQSREAAAGAEVADSGDIAAFSRGQAHVSVAGQTAEIQLAHRLGDLVGVDTSTDEGMRQVMFAREGAAQSITIPFESEAKERLIEELNLNSHSAAALRAHPGGGKLSLALDANGESQHAYLTAGNEVVMVDSSHIRRGHDETASFGQEVTGGRALLLNTEDLASELDKAYGDGLLEGTYDETRMAALTLGIAKYVSESGLEIDARAQETVSYNMSMAAGAGVEGGGKKGAPSPYSASVKGTIDKQETDARGASTDLAIQYTREAIEAAQRDAVADYRVEHGRVPTNEDREEVLTRMAGSIQHSMEELRRDIVEETSTAQGGHDVDPFDGPKGPASPSGSTGYPAYPPAMQR